MEKKEFKELVTLVEVNSTSGAFCFKTFKGKNSLQQAQKFCKELSKCATLSAFVRECETKHYAKGGKINTKSIAVKNAERELKKAKQSKITSWIDKASRNLDKVYEAEEMIDNLRANRQRI